MLQFDYKYVSKIVAEFIKHVGGLKFWQNLMEEKLLKLTDQEKRSKQ